MKINLLAVGTKMPAWVVEGYRDYAQRLPKEFSLHLIEVPAEKRYKNSDIPQLLQIESARLFAAIPHHSLSIALERNGKPLSTRELAEKFMQLQSLGQDISLLIGGPEGISPGHLKQAHELWSLSSLTLPHPLVRVVIAEQIYRVWSLLNKHPYHR